jgi:7-cyano-7-deazaguanine synthase
MKIVVSHSGGLDSSVLLYHLKANGHQVLPISVHYGQRHEKEIEAAYMVCTHAGVRHRVADLSHLRMFMGGSSQTDWSVPVPHGHYTDESMKATVVPNRNMLLLAVAGCYAVSQGADAVAYAAHAGDHAIYPDCRPEFADAMAKAFGLCDFKPLELSRPFVGKSKADIVKIGASLGVPFGLTWSCYEGGDFHCGKCGTCVERREAFQLAGVEDPTRYKE